MTWFWPSRERAAPPESVPPLTSMPPTVIEPRRTAEAEEIIDNRPQRPVQQGWLSHVAPPSLDPLVFGPPP